jgi:branched-chain amino acid transport system ATP-binding protein
MELVKQLAASRGITILFCEHDMQVVFSVATSIMVMRQGQTIIQDAPENVRANKQVQDAYLGGNDA